MPNAYISRPVIHEWSNTIGDNPNAHEAALTRLLKDQRRLTRFVEENAENLPGTTGGVTIYLMGVIMRMFDLAGGRLKAATWDQVRAASERVSGVAGELLPFDAGFKDRVRAVEWRAQPHILDEALMALFDVVPDETEEQLDDNDGVRIFFLLWVATEVLDLNWRPAKGFSGESSYTYTHFEPKQRSETAQE